MSNHGRTPVLELPYQTRQIIIVAEDAVVEASRKEEEKALKEDKKGFDWVGLANTTVAIFSRSPVLIFGEIAVEAYQAWGRAKASGLPVLQVARSEALQITFPIGHPRNGVIYIGHPSIPQIYYPMAEFHRTIFEHKLSEAVRLLMQLGAAQIRVEHVSGWANDFSAKISVPLGGASETVGGHAETHSKAQSQFLYEAQLAGTTVPSLPSDLTWYKHEPTWQAVADGRLNHGLMNFSIGLSYTDDFGINAGLAAKFQKTGLEVGGKFEDHRSTVWRIDGRFGDGHAMPDTPKRRSTHRPTAAA